MKKIHLILKQSAWEYFKLSMKFLLQSKTYKLIIFFTLIYSLYPLKIYDNTVIGFHYGITFFNLVAFIIMAIWVSFVFITISLIMTLWRIIKFRKFFNEEVEYFFDKNKFISKNKYVKSEYKWDFIKKVRRSSKVFILYTRSDTAPLFYIPERAFETKENLTNFMDLLYEKGFKLK